MTKKAFPIAQCQVCKGFYPQHFVKPVGFTNFSGRTETEMCHECRDAKQSNMDAWAKKHGLLTYQERVDRGLAED